MTDFSGAFGDRRRDAAVQRLEQAMVEQSSVVVRQLGGSRAGEISAHRVLSNEAVTPARMLERIAAQTAVAVAGCRVVVAQDTAVINQRGRERIEVGPTGRCGKQVMRGFFIHAAVAVMAEPQCEAVLGLVDAQIWSREDGGVEQRRQRRLADKESHRWVRSMQLSSHYLAAARQIIVVGDAESDIYAVFARRPCNVELLVRAGQDRATAEQGRLFEVPSQWPALCCTSVQVVARHPGEVTRQAKLELRAGTVVLRHPRNGLREGDPQELSLMLIEARECDAPPDVQPLHWRLLTTLPGQDADAAIEAVQLYRLRWRIEQCFRMLKNDGLQLPETQTVKPKRLFNLATLAMTAAVRIVQLVDARDGSPRPATDAASPVEIQAAMALCPKLEGATERQKNLHPIASLAWLSWIVARLGGWNCYGKPPGPKTMRRGWNRFTAIAEGFALSKHGYGIV